MDCRDTLDFHQRQQGGLIGMPDARAEVLTENCLIHPIQPLKKRKNQKHNEFSKSGEEIEEIESRKVSVGMTNV